MEQNTVINTISQYYNSLVEQYGHDARACDYGRKESQLTKFTVMSEATDYTNTRVLDVGCGFADFSDFLAAKFQNVRYTGVDISPKMVETARHLHKGTDIRLQNIFETPLQEQFDVVTANGIFYLLGENAESLMQHFIQEMYKLTTNVLAFNSLSSWASEQEPNEFYADPVKIFAFCKSITPWVVLRHDYHARDFTMFMYKERQR